MKKLIFFLILMATVYSQRRPADRYFATNITITNNTVNLEMPKGPVGTIYDLLIINEELAAPATIKVRWNSTANSFWTVKANRIISLSGLGFGKVFISNDSGVNVTILFIVVGH